MEFYDEKINNTLYNTIFNTLYPHSGKLGASTYGRTKSP